MLLGFVLALYILLSITERLRKMNPKYPPGPVGLPFMGSLPFLGEEPHKTMAEFAKKYGNIFSLYMGTKYTVVLNDFESMKEGISHVAALNRPPNLFKYIVGGSGFAGANGPPWKEQRHFCMTAMRDLGLGKGPWESMVDDEISCFTKELEALQGEGTDISSFLRSSINNNILSLLIGRSLDKEKEKDIAQLFCEFSEIALKVVGPSDPAVLIPGCRKFMEFFKLAGYEAVPRVTKKIHEFFKGEIQRHKSSEETREVENFINRFLDQMEAINKTEYQRSYDFTDALIEGNLNALFLGGTDTVFNSVTFMFRLLAARPDVQKKIHDELDSILGCDGRASFEERRKTPYTFATVLEMERYFSIVPLSTTRMVMEDFELGGYIIPKGAVMHGNLWAIHNDPKYWEQPETFLPERFLTEDGSALLSKLPRGYVVFSTGKRNCPGETVALTEIYLYLCSVMRKFRISPLPGEEVNFRRINGLVVQLEPQKLRFTLREP